MKKKPHMNIGTNWTEKFSCLSSGMFGSAEGVECGTINGKQQQGQRQGWAPPSSQEIGDFIYFFFLSGQICIWNFVSSADCCWIFSWTSRWASPDFWAPLSQHRWLFVMAIWGQAGGFGVFCTLRLLQAQLGGRWSQTSPCEHSFHPLSL